MPSILTVMDAFWKRPYSLVRDSTHLLLLEFQKRGFSLHLTCPQELSASPTLLCKTHLVKALSKKPYFKLYPTAQKSLHDFDVILMRKDPPVDKAYLRASKILSRVVPIVRVINNPTVIERFSEKSLIFKFPKWIPATLITQDSKKAAAFLKKHQKIVLKPLNSYAGKGVRLIETQKQLPSKMQDPLMFQEFLPVIQARGEKRIFIVDGKAVGAILKKPKPSTFIANPDLGARLSKTTLTKREKLLCLDVGKFLKKNGVLFAGLDVIGERLTEINFTSPGLLWEWNALTGKHYEKMIVDKIIQATTPPRYTSGRTTNTEFHKLR